MDSYEWTESKITTLDDFLTVVGAYRAKGKKIVTTNGCFDVLHNGHVHLLNQARNFGDILIVGLNSDSSVRRIKGSDRPLHNEQDRASMLAALKSVDHVVVFDESTPVQLLGKIKPDIHCKAGEYNAEAMPETETVTSNGGQIKIVPLIPGYSTSQFIEKILVSKTKNEITFEENITGVLDYFLASGNVLRQTGYQLSEEIIKAAGEITKSLQNYGKILCCGNGGSAADAQHFAAELVGRFKLERSAWPAISLSSDPSIMTAIGNDYGYEQVYARQVSAWGQENDVLVAISTSGTSPNIIAAAKEAKQRNMKIIGLTGSKHSTLRDLSDICLAVPSLDTPQIQQAHITILHSICDQIEKTLK